MVSGRRPPRSTWMVGVLLLGCALFEYEMLPDRSLQQLDNFLEAPFRNIEVTSLSSPSSCPKRAVVVYLPFEKVDTDTNKPLQVKQEFVPQLRWLLYSWMEMRRHFNTTTPTNEGCKVDVLIVTKHQDDLLEELGCIHIGKDDDLAALPPTATVSSQKDTSRCLVLSGYKPEIELPNRFMDSIEAMPYAFKAFPKLMRSYDWLLRTDLDVFLTPRFATWMPDRFSVGLGAFCFAPFHTCARLKQIAVEQKWLQSDTVMVENVGSTWYGPAAEIERCAKLSVQIARHLDSAAFTSEEKTTPNWPKWHYGVLSMYAGQIAINSCMNGRFDKRTDMLDFPSENRGPVERIAHIHTWPQYELFSKVEFLAGKYKHINIHQLNQSVVRDYATFMAIASQNPSIFSSVTSLQ